MKRNLIMVLWLFESLSSLSVGVWASEIKSDEIVQLYPAVAHLNENNEWEAMMTAWVYEQEVRPGVKDIFARWLGIDTNRLTEEEKNLYEMRTQLFRFDSERNKKISVQIAGEKKIKFPLTNAQGISQKKLIYKLSDAEPELSQVKWLALKVVLPGKDSREFVGRLMLVPREGLGVISDIDDTIKASHVLDKKQLLLNTFVRPFVIAEGMAGFYQSLVASNMAVSFHYVSSSPHQLYPTLDTFLKEHNFPEGSLHLRYVRITEEVFIKGSSSARHKHKTIRGLLEKFPNRQFLFIGDSGEADPEIYAKIAEDYPQQVRAIFIRNVTNEDANAERYKKIIYPENPINWYIFDAPDKLPANIYPPRS